MRKLFVLVSQIDVCNEVRETRSKAPLIYERTFRNGKGMFKYCLCCFLFKVFWF